MLNRELGANFDPDAFDHVALFDAEQRVDRDAAALARGAEVTIAGLDLTVSFAAGEEMRTEISAKFTRERVAAELTAAGLALAAWHTDEREWFALSLARRAG